MMLVKNEVPSAPTRLECERCLIALLTSTAEVGTLGKKSEVTE
jgi:hypothetical protein